ncbi:MAG: Calx-beta domain-containing protein, partial [Blastocatellia bacterium]
MRNLLNFPLRSLCQRLFLAKPSPRYTLMAALMLTALALIGGIHLARARAAGTISLTTLGAAYAQNFDTLASSGTSSAVPTGWDFAEAGANANTTYTAGAGSSATGDTYSFGASGSGERAFGGLQSGSLVPTIGASFTNNTGATITSLRISYTGEEWRLGAAGRADRLDFQYSRDATSLTTGAWTDFDALDFVTPDTATAGAKNGNSATDRMAISATITGLSIPIGATFFIRWLDFNASGSDDGLAIDDFSLTPMGAGSTPSLSLNDVSANEGVSGATTFTFTVSLTAPAGAGGVTFDIATQDNTATTADNDYVAKSLTSQTIPQGQMAYAFGVTVNGDTNVEPNESFFVNVANVAGANVADGQGVGAIVNDDFAITPIHDIQGNTETPNFVGMVKAIRGVVVGDFQGSANLNGFFVQEEDADADADPATSEGVFIFDSGALTDVNVGDNVTVTGTVTNFGAPSGLTELTSLISVVTNSSGNPLPATSAVALPVANAPAADLERFEGMRV